MGIVEKLATAFPDVVHTVDDAFIMANPNIMEIPGPLDLRLVVPAYMFWCAKHPHDAALVSDFTLQALAEYGRCKDPENRYLNFRYLCSQPQMEAVSAFLAWAHESLLLSRGRQLERARRNWDVWLGGSTSAQELTHKC